jgi:hypothetical protein
MSATSPFRIRVWKTAKAQPADMALPLSTPGDSCAVELRCLAGIRGNSGIHLVVSDAGGVRLRAEVAANPNEVVTLQVGLDASSAPYVWSRAAEVLLLPFDDRDPSPPIHPAGPNAPLDVAIIVDGTLRNWPPPPPKKTDQGEPPPPPPAKSPYLLDVKEELWAPHVDKLLTFVQELAAARDWRAAVLAFGDQDPPTPLSARDLRVAYRLKPEETNERALQPFGFDALRKRLIELPATPGCDFVDALADALAACINLQWRADARKVIVLTGDSPGFSILHALPRGADLCVREKDVDTTVAALHKLGVEIVTIYHAPDKELRLDNVTYQRELLAAVRSQYARLASLPAMAFEEATFEPQEAGRTVASIATPFARGPAFAELVRVGSVSSDETRTRH